MATMTAPQLFYYLAWSYPVLFGCFVVLALISAIRFWNTRGVGWHLEYLADAAREVMSGFFFGYRGIIAFAMPYREELLFGRVLALLLMFAVIFHLVAALTGAARARRLLPPNGGKSENSTTGGLLGGGAGRDERGGASLFSRRALGASGDVGGRGDSQGIGRQLA